MKIKFKSKTATENGIKEDVVKRNEADKYVMYVGNRVKTSAIVSKVIGAKKPTKFDLPGFLIVRGDKPGMIARQVRWDGKDLYACKTEDGGILYGLLSALNNTKNAKFKAEIITLGELMKRALQFNRVIEVTKAATGKRHQVALLNPFGELYVVGLEPKQGRVVLHNMEPPANYNKKPVQYTDPKDMRVDIAKFLAQTK